MSRVWKRKQNHAAVFLLLISTQGRETEQWERGVCLRLEHPGTMPERGSLGVENENKLKVQQNTKTKKKRSVR